MGAQPEPCRPFQEATQSGTGNPTKVIQPTNQIPEQGPKLSNQPKESLGSAQGHPTNKQKSFGRLKGTRSTRGYLWAGPMVILPTNRNPSEGPREPYQPGGIPLGRAQGYPANQRYPWQAPGIPYPTRGCIPGKAQGYPANQRISLPRDTQPASRDAAGGLQNHPPSYLGDLS